MNDNDSILNETNTGESSIRPSEIDYEDYDLVRPSQSSTAQYLKNLDTKIKNANLTKNKKKKRKQSDDEDWQHY